MPTPPYARLQVQRNGGAIQPQGVLYVTAGDVITLTAQSTVGVTQWLWELYDFPPGFATPSGWIKDPTTNILYVAGSPNPATVSIPSLATTTFGPIALRLRVNGNPLQYDSTGRLNTGFNPSLTDEGTILKLKDAAGIEGIASGESTQGDAAGIPSEAWVGPYMRDLRAISAAIGAGGGGGGGGGGGPTYLPASAPPNSTNNTLAVSSGGVTSWNPVGGYQVLTAGISGTGVAGVVEVGSSQAAVNVALTYNFTPTSVSYSYSGVATGGPTSVTPTGTSSSFTITPGSAFTSSTNAAALVITVTAVDPAGAPHTASMAMTYAAKIVYGSLAPAAETVDQTMWNTLAGLGSNLTPSRGGNYNFASALGDDQCFGMVTSLGTPTLTDPSTSFTYPPTSLGTASITENGTTQAVTFWKAGLPGSTFTPLKMS